MPDYQDKERKLIVEMDAHWIHMTERGRKRDAERDARFAAEGWRVLHVSSVDLKQPEVLRKKIAGFIEEVD